MLASARAAVLLLLTASACSDQASPTPADGAVSDAAADDTGASSTDTLVDTGSCLGAAAPCGPSDVCCSGSCVVTSGFGTCP